MTVFFADDVTAVLEGLKHIIDWQELGFTICGTAKNGEEALQKILDLRPDLVLIDIRMPKLSGMDVLRLSREQSFQGRFIILSGYSSFSYAQTAIRYQADQYLTKPIDEEELAKAVVRVRETLLEEERSHTRLYQYRQKAREGILCDLLRGQLDFHSFHKSDLNLEFPVFQVIIYKNYTKQPFQPVWNFAELLRVSNQDGNSFEQVCLDGQDVILLKGEFAAGRFKNLLRHYRQNPQKGSPLDSIFLAYGPCVYRMEQVSESYLTASALSCRQFYAPRHTHVLGPPDLPFKEQMTALPPAESAAEYARKFLDYIQVHNTAMIQGLLDELGEKLYYTSNSITSVRHFLADIFIQVKESLANIYKFSEIPLPANASLIELIECKDYLYEILRFFFDQFVICANALGTFTNQSVIDEIIYYINNNYRESLRLESIAQLFGYNSSYLGKLFYKQVGEQFNPYVDRIRIEQAILLLEGSSLKVYEIAEQVGYRSVDYFHKKFRKHTGMSPSQYRRK